MEINNVIKNRIKAIKIDEWKRKWNEDSKLIWRKSIIEKRIVK